VLFGKVISVGVDLSEASILVSKCKEHKYLQSAEGLQCQATIHRSKEFSAICIPFVNFQVLCIIEVQVLPDVEYFKLLVKSLGCEVN